MNLPELLSANMKRLRKKEGITQADLAERSHTSTSYIAEIETMRKYPAPGKMETIAKALHVEPYELLMPANRILNAENRSSLAYKMVEDIRSYLNDVEERYTGEEEQITTPEKSSTFPEAHQDV